MARINRISLFVMIFLLISVGMVYAQTYGKESLRGLKGVYVLVEKLDPNIEKDGLLHNSIQTDVELKLRVAGIKVLTKEECLKEPGRPSLYVKVGSLKNIYHDIYAYLISLELKQDVYLLLNPKIYGSSTTWETNEELGMISVLKVNSIRDYVKDQVDKFINDYLEVNPK